MVKIRIGGHEASIDGGAWSSEAPGLAKLLTSMRDPLGPGGDDPDPDLTAATAAAKELGGTVIDAGPDDEDGDGPPDPGTGPAAAPQPAPPAAARKFRRR